MIFSRKQTPSGSETPIQPLVTRDALFDAREVHTRRGREKEEMIQRIFACRKCGVNNTVRWKKRCLPSLRLDCTRSFICPRKGHHRATGLWNLYYSTRILLSFSFCPTAFIYSIRYTSSPPFASRYYSGCTDTTGVATLSRFKHNGVFKFLLRWGGRLSALVKHVVGCDTSTWGGTERVHCGYCE